MLSKAHWTSHSACLALGEWSHHRDYLGHEDLFCTVLLVYSCHLHCLSYCKLCCYENWSSCIFLKNIFIYLFILTVQGFSWRAGDRGLLSGCGAQASNCSGLSFCRAWALGHMGFRSCSLQPLVHRLSSCGHGPRCSVAHGIFLDQGLNPGLPHWQTDSSPLSHQGSPGVHVSF